MIIKCYFVKLNFKLNIILKYKMSYNIKETLIELQPIPIDIEGTKLILYQMENCICKIVKDDGRKGT